MNHITLRDVIESDLPIFFEHQRDPEACALADFPTRDKETFMTHWTNIMQNEAVILKTILHNEKVAGNIVSWVQEGQQEVGYWLGRDYWGKGIAILALSEFLLAVKIRPLMAYAAKRNIASIRVLEKCGFKAQQETEKEIILKIE